jgi:DNA-3-methyladenine glycosylase
LDDFMPAAHPRRRRDLMLGEDFFQRDVLTVAHDLIGVELYWQGCAGIIVETEAYAVEDDPACHTASRPSARDFVQRQPPGTAYVYLNYGMYWLFNLLVKGGDRDGLILIRALEPTRGIEAMQIRRQKQREHDLCSGPGKLGRALGITGEHHGTPMIGPQRPTGCGLSWARRDLNVVRDIRVGIREAADFPWRFLAAGNHHVSVPQGRVKAPPLLPAATPRWRRRI